MNRAHKIAGLGLPAEWHKPFGVAFLVAYALAIALDLLLVFTGHTSISLGTWIATEAHPTLIAAGILATCEIAYLVRDDWRMVLFQGLMGGHLFVHQ